MISKIAKILKKSNAISERQECKSELVREEKQKKLPVEKSNLGLGFCAPHLFTLCSLSIANPIFEVTAKGVDFFVIHGSRPVDILSLIFILSIGIPLILFVIEFVLRLFSRRAQLSAHFIFIAVLISLYAARGLTLFESIDSGVSIIIIACVIGIGSAVLYAFTRPFRSFVSIISPVCLLFPLLFVFGSQVSQIVFPAGYASSRLHAQRQVPSFTDKPPIVLVALDELPIISLLDAKGNIDAKRFPHIAEFAKTAYWFRNTTTVSPSTTLAIPSILTGIHPTEILLPNVIDHPDNLFTWLGNEYKLNVWETASYLCPDELSGKHWRNILKYPDRIRSLLIDLGIVYLHIILPFDYSRRLPDISDQWGNFLNNTPCVVFDPKQTWKKVPGKEEIIQKRNKITLGDRSGLFRKFVSSIDEDSHGSLNFFHLILPHTPWEYLPSGRKYWFHRWLEGVTIKKDRWSGPQDLVDQYLQRHLLQVSYTDRLLGELIKHLKEINLFDDALIIFTADHGCSFTSGDTKRLISERNLGGVLFVPLLIKLPEQKNGIVSDIDAELVDIVPTIDDVLGSELPWKATGKSLLTTFSDLPREKQIMGNHGKAYTFSYKELLSAKIKAHARIVMLFNLDDVNATLYRYGKYRGALSASR